MSFHCCHNLVFRFFKFYNISCIILCPWFPCVSQSLVSMYSVFISCLLFVYCFFELVSAAGLFPWLAGSQGGLRGLTRGFCARDICLPRTVWVFFTVLWHCGLLQLLHPSLDRRAFVINDCFSPRKAHGSCIFDFTPVWNVCLLPS